MWDMKGERKECSRRSQGVIAYTRTAGIKYSDDDQRGLCNLELPTRINLGDNTADDNRNAPGSTFTSPKCCRTYVPSELTIMLARLFTTGANISTKLNSVTEHDLVHFSKILSSTAILSTLPPISNPAQDLAPFNNDWMGRFRGRSTTVLKPKSTHQVSQIMKWCYDKRIGVVPQGGNTGLVGGSVPINDEVVLSLSNMNNVRSFDPISGSSAFFRFTSSSKSSRMQVS